MSSLTAGKWCSTFHSHMRHICISSAYISGPLCTADSCGNILRLEPNRHVLLQNAPATATATATATIYSATAIVFFLNHQIQQFVAFFTAGDLTDWQVQARHVFAASFVHCHWGYCSHLSCGPERMQQRRVNSSQKLQFLSSHQLTVSQQPMLQPTLESGSAKHPAPPWNPWLCGVILQPFGCPFGPSSQRLLVLLHPHGSFLGAFWGSLLQLLC